MAKFDIQIPVFDHSAQPNVGRMPPWIRQSLADGGYSDTAKLVHGNRLTTVCEEARCPNRGECWGRGTATFMLLGDTCTRACGFCAVKTGRPDGLDADEPRRIVEAVKAMALERHDRSLLPASRDTNTSMYVGHSRLPASRDTNTSMYVVLTSVNRDDLADGGIGIYAATLSGLRAALPQLGLEVLTPDFRHCQEQAVLRLGEALGIDGSLVWGHNVETVPSLYKTVRKGARYERSLRMLELAALHPQMEAKSALMLGLGETVDEVEAVMRDLRSVGVTRLALGQYLRPTRYHLPVKAYIEPETFAAYEASAKALGFSWVKAGAMVRSSYHAEE